MRKALLLVLAASAMAASARAEMRDAIMHVRTVSLGEIGDPDDYNIVSANGGGKYDSRTFVPNQSGVSNGAAPDAAHPHTLTDAMQTAGFHLGEELKLAIADALLTAGHTVVPAEAKDADVRLVTAIVPRSAGYSDAVLGDDLMPGFTVRVFLMDVKSNRILFTSRFFYGQTAEAAQARGTRIVYPDARYRFTSVDALLSDPQSAAAGIRAGVVPVAAEIAKAVAR
jgi:hypothetical protein